MAVTKVNEPQLVDFRKKDIQDNVNVNVNVEVYQNTEQHNYDDVLKIIGFGRIHWILVLTSGLLLMMVINETSGMSFITISSQCDFATTSTQKAWVSSASFFGILISSYFWGYMSDRLGRRTVLLKATCCAIILSCVSVFISYFWLFIATRVLIGVFIAGASSTTYAYLCEFFLPKHRSFVVNTSSTFVGISNLYTPTVAWLVLSMDWLINVHDLFILRPWRLLILFNMLPGLIAVLILWVLPESPKLLYSRHKDDKAYAALDWICKQNTGSSLTDFKVFKVTLQETANDDNKLLQNDIVTSSKTICSILREMWTDTVPLFKKPHVQNYLISCLVMFGMLFCSSGVGVWYPDIQNRIGANTNNKPLTVCQVIETSKQATFNQSITEEFCDDTISTKTFTDTCTLGLIYVIGFIVQGLIIKPIGRRNVIGGALLLSGAFGLAMNWIDQPMLLVANFILFLVLPGLCISVLGGAVVDLVPTQLRGKAVCICFMLGRAGGVVGINLFGILVESYCAYTFVGVALFMIVCGALTFIIPIK